MLFAGIHATKQPCCLGGIQLLHSKWLVLYNAGWTQTFGLCARKTFILTALDMRPMNQTGRVFQPVSV